MKNAILCCISFVFCWACQPSSAHLRPTTSMQSVCEHWETFQIPDLNFLVKFPDFPAEVKQAQDHSGIDIKCYEYRQCYIETGKISVQFPGPPRLKKIDPVINVSDYHIDQYNAHHFYGDSVLLFGLEVLSHNKADSVFKDQDLDKLKSLSVLTSQLFQNAFPIHERTFDFKGHKAIEQTLNASSRDKNGSSKEIKVRNLYFIHDGKCIKLYTIADASTVLEAKNACFFDSVVLR